MLFAIAFETFAADPMVFRAMANLFQITGHSAICVASGRAESMAGRMAAAVVGSAMPIIFDNGEDPNAAAAAAGYIIDVWINR